MSTPLVELDVFSHQPVAGSSLLVLLDPLEATDTTGTLLVFGRLVRVRVR